MKKILMRVLRFILANICCVALYLIAMLAVIIISPDTFESFKSNAVFGNIVYAFSTVFFILPFYYFYFVKNEDFKTTFVRNTSGGGYAVKDALEAHLRTYAKQEGIILAVLFALLAFLPESIVGRFGLGFAVFCSTLFYQLIPFAPLAMLLWAAYIAVIYILCLVLAMKKWDKERLYVAK